MEVQLSLDGSMWLYLLLKWKTSVPQLIIFNTSYLWGEQMFDDFIRLEFHFLETVYLNRTSKATYV